MPINRRECRRYVGLEPPMSVKNALFHADSLDYIIRTSVRNIDKKKTLILYVHLREAAAQGDFKPTLVLFQTKTCFASLLWDEGKIKWRTSSLNEILDNIERSAFYLKDDAERIKRFCKQAGEKALDQLLWFQYKVQEKEASLRCKKKEKELQLRMRQIPSLPRGFKKWALKECWPAYLFYSTAQHKQVGYCTACSHEVQLHGARHNRMGTCPHCGKEVHCKSAGLCEKITDRKTLLLVQKITPEQVVVRIYKAYLTLEPYRKPVLELWESARQYIREIDGIGYFDCYYTQQNSPMKWKKGTRPYAYQDKFIDQLYGNLYCQNLTDELDGTPWKYSQLNDFYKSDEKPMNVAFYLIKYLCYPFIEYLVKLHLYRLTVSVVYGDNYNLSEINYSGKNLQEILALDRESLLMLREIDGDTYDLRLFHLFSRGNLHINIPFRNWLRENTVSIYSLSDCIQLLHYMRSEKLIQYLEHQLTDASQDNELKRYSNMQSVLRDYVDYLDACKELHYNLTDKKVLFPRKLPEMHDKTTALVKIYGNEICDRWLSETYEMRRAHYGFESNGLTILPLKALSELQAESNALGHCVKNYADRVAKGKCEILFIRRIGETDRPYYTMELKENQIVQVQGLDHCLPTQEVEAFLEEWKASVLVKHIKKSA